MATSLVIDTAKTMPTASTSMEEFGFMKTFGLEKNQVKTLNVGYIEKS
jgi:hypothetical protein